MAGVRKLLKQAQKMQQALEAVQQKLDQEEIEISAGGGAVMVTITASQRIVGLNIDPELLKEDKAFIETTVLAAFQEALDKAKARSDEAVNAVSGGMNLPGFM